MISDSLRKQIEFISELEKLKLIYRNNKVLDKIRYETSAEHSWHIALMAIVLADHSVNKNLDMLRVVKMLLIHDIVEIDAGDSFLYDDKQMKDAFDNEKCGAERIFGLLPEEQKNEFVSLWEEFEERKTQEALFAAAMDGLQPLINHFITAKENDNPFNMTFSSVMRKKLFIRKASPNLWEIALEFIEKSIGRGLYDNDRHKGSSEGAD